MEALYRKPRRRGSVEPEIAQIAVSGNLILHTVSIALRFDTGSLGSIELTCTDALKLADALRDMVAHAKKDEKS